jgi:ribosomal protein S27AE
VPNHARITTGDLIVFWDKKRLIGASVIDDIQIASAEKSIYTCPACGKGSFKKRLTKQPRYKCFRCPATFNTRIETIKPVTSYRSLHAQAWTDLESKLPGPWLRALCVKPSSQLSLRPLNGDAFFEALISTGVDLRETLLPLRFAEGAQDL